MVGYCLAAKIPLLWIFEAVTYIFLGSHPNCCIFRKTTLCWCVVKSHLLPITYVGLEVSDGIKSNLLHSFPDSFSFAWFHPVSFQLVVNCRDLAAP
jgi:hypothetical protein